MEGLSSRTGDGMGWGERDAEDGVMGVQSRRAKLVLGAPWARGIGGRGVPLTGL